MKKLILVSFCMLSLIACQKENQEVKSDKENKDMQLMSWNPDLHVSKLVKFNRDYILGPGGKWDCSKPGKQCQITMDVPDKQKAQMDVLDVYLASNNSSGYFSNENWSVLFPEITDFGLNALINNETVMYKKEASEGGRNYVLSTASNESEIAGDNTIAVWSFAN